MAPLAPAGDDTLDVVVVGAGPVGLALALDLARRGLRVQVLEARATAPHGSRAIGLHPPGLAVLASLGLAEALVAEGRRVRLGRAVGVHGPLGTVRLEDAHDRFPFVLTVPQATTERHLRAALTGTAPAALTTGVRVTAVTQDANRTTVRGVDRDGVVRAWRARFVVGADGRDGVVRSAVGVQRVGGPYPDRYAMADLADDEGRFASDEAWIVLHRDGVVEGFPLPGGVRRWVVRRRGATSGREESLDAATPEAIARWVAAEVADRLGGRFDPTLRGSASAFGVERWLAARFTVGRVALIGDAAHVLSPIGGQGMNLGWLDAAAVAAVLDPASSPDDVVARLAEVGGHRRAAARRAIARAAWNTALGRPRSTLSAAFRDVVVRALLRPPLAPATRRRFVMEGLA